MGRHSVCQHNEIDELEAPEGGWGWISALGLAIMFIVSVAPVLSFSLIFGDLLESLGEGTETITLISSVNGSFSLLTGLVLNFVLTRYSCRQVGLVGSIIFFLGSFLSAFSYSTLFLLFSYGLIQGIGMGLLFPAGLTNFNHYFVRRRTFAMGVTQMIIGVGTIIMPTVVQKLLQEYGFRGTQAILSAISLHNVVSAVVLKPVEKHSKCREKLIVYHPEIKTTYFDDMKYITESCTQETVNTDTSIKQNGSQGIENTRKIDKHSIKEMELKYSFDPIQGEETEDADTEIGIEAYGNEKPETNKEFQLPVPVLQTIEILYNSSSKQEEYTPTEQNKNIISTGGDIRKTLMNEEDNETLQTAAVSNKKCKCDKQNIEDDDSIDQNILMDSYLKVCYAPNRTSIDTGSFKAGNPVSISDSRATVKSLESWTSSCGKGRHKHSDLFDIKSEDNSGKRNIFIRSWLAAIHFMELGLLKDPIYVNIVAGIAIGFMADITYCTLYPFILLKLKYSNADTAIIISIVAASDLGGRIFLTLVGACYPQIKNRHIFLMGSIASVIGRSFLVLFEDFTTLAFVNGCLGFFRSFIHLSLSLVFAEYYLENFPAAYGLYTVIAGILGLILLPFIGWVRDITGSYPICINTLNIIHIVPCILWIIELFYDCIQSRSNRKDS